VVAQVALGRVRLVVALGMRAHGRRGRPGRVGARYIGARARGRSRPGARVCLVTLGARARVQCRHVVALGRVVALGMRALARLAVAHGTRLVLLVSFFSMRLRYHQLADADMPAFAFRGA